MEEKARAFFKNKANFLFIGVALAAAFLIFPNQFFMQSWPSSPGDSPFSSLDGSWNLALSYAGMKGLTWGKDFIFTYGPLGSLCTRVGWGKSWEAFLLFDIFISFNYFLMFFITLKQSKNKILSFLAIAAIVYVLPLWVGSAWSMILLFFLVFWIRLSIDNPKPFYYIMQIAIITLMFFIKFNTGLIVFVLYFVGIVYNLIAKNTKVWLLMVYSFLPVALVFCLSKMLNVALTPYINSGFEMVAGYNEIMYLDNTFKKAFRFFCIISLLLLIIFTMNVYKKDKQRKQEYFKWLVTFFIFAVPFFVMYKQSFVRADEGHIVDFFLYLPLALICNLDLHRHSRNIIAKVLFVIVLAMPVYYLYSRTNRIPAIEEKFSKEQYFKELSDFTPTSAMHIFGKGNQLNDTIKQRIGKSTVDVYPWSVQMLLENNLNYLPRPICQSYSAYTPYLEEQNFEHYNNSATAPDFVIYDYFSMDDRYPMFDEGKLNLALYSNYNLVKLFNFDGRKLLLLQKKSNFRPIKFEKIREYDSATKTTLIPKQGFFYEITVNYSMLGKIRGIFDYAPEIKLGIKAKEGEIHKYKTSKSLVQSGVFSTSFVNNTEDAALFFSHQPTLGQVSYYNFRPEKESMYTESKTITEYKITQ